VLQLIVIIIVMIIIVIKLVCLKKSLELMINTVGIAQYGYHALPSRIFISCIIMLERVHYLFRAFCCYQC